MGKQKNNKRSKAKPMTGYYLRIVPDGTIPPNTQVWLIDENEATRIDVSNSKQGYGCYFKANLGEKIWDSLKRQTDWFEPNGENPFHKCDLAPGQFYPRIARPNDRYPLQSPGSSRSTQSESVVVAVARSQLSTLTHQLERICQTVHPEGATLKVFGHDIRNLLILACTEVEAHWRGVLIANGFRDNGKLNTNNYIRLNKPMRLAEYAVSFPSYPWLPPFKPYKDWSSSKSPTEDLEWYGAYHAVKHDREHKFEQATLEHVFEAVSSCIVMMVAQFGWPDPIKDDPQLRSFFHLSSKPNWSPSEVYIAPYNVSDWTPVNFKF